MQKKKKLLRNNNTTNINMYEQWMQFPNHPAKNNPRQVDMSLKLINQSIDHDFTDCVSLQSLETIITFITLIMKIKVIKVMIVSISISISNQCEWNQSVLQNILDLHIDLVTGLGIFVLKNGSYLCSRSLVFLTPMLSKRMVRCYIT